jgi:hypothetical protein
MKKTKKIVSSKKDSADLIELKMHVRKVDNVAVDLPYYSVNINGTTVGSWTGDLREARRRMQNLVQSYKEESVATTIESVTISSKQ